VLRILLPVLVAVVAGFALSRALSDGSSTSAVQSAASLPNVAAARAETRETPIASPTPCPYCDQREDRWRDVTSVPPPALLGTSAALIDGACDTLIYGTHSREQREPASLAKIVTAMVARDSLPLDKMIDITVNGWNLAVENDSSIMGLEAGMRLSVEELLYGLLLPSGNDAALQLAQAAGGVDRFVALMNQRVQRLGLTDTLFRNPHGLDDSAAHTTPFDMAILGRELLKDPKLATIVSTQTRDEPWHDNGKIWNGNYLIYIYKDAVGIKTGYTEEAGWSIVSAARRDGRLLVASVFNSGDIYWDSMRLFDWAFDNVPSLCHH
jgi:D-alanyl-D-alanine carboxypeptidase